MNRFSAALRNLSLASRVNGQFKGRVYWTGIEKSTGATDVDGLGHVKIRQSSFAVNKQTVGWQEPQENTLPDHDFLATYDGEWCKFDVESERGQLYAINLTGLNGEPISQPHRTLSRKETPLRAPIGVKDAINKMRYKINPERFPDTIKEKTKKARSKGLKYDPYGALYHGKKVHQTFVVQKRDS